MNITEFIKGKILRFLGLARLNGNPNDGRLTYINDDEAIRRSNIRANRIWYLGDGDELLNWYTNQQTYGYAQNPIYNRNKRQYFWGRSVDECVKRIHSGVPKAIVDTMSNIVGMPTITCDRDDELKAIFDANDFEYMLTQQARPMASVEGDGAFKINMNPALSPRPMVEYYGAEDWGPIYKSNVLLGMWFASYYKDKDGKDYVLIESRSLRPEGLAIEFRLFKVGKSNDLIPADKSQIPEIENLNDVIVNGIHRLMAQPLRYFFDPLRRNRGKSIYDGKLDLFDFMDEILTQAGQTNRVSTPVEYYPTDLLQRTDRGVPILPKIYNRQYVKIDAAPDGDGNMNNQIQTTQPDLNFDKFMQLFRETMSASFVGYISPSSLGFDVAKDDNADAQREKEKQTIFTRNTYVKVETKALTSLCDMLLMAQDYMDTGVFKDVDHGISVKYDEFANPSFESELQALGPAWASGQISTERYVSLLWAGKLSDEDMLKEIQWLDDNRKRDDFDIDSLMEHENATRTGADIPGAEPEEEEPQIPEE